MHTPRPPPQVRQGAGSAGPSPTRPLRVTPAPPPSPPPPARHRVPGVAAASARVPSVTAPSPLSPHPAPPGPTGRRGGPGVGGEAEGRALRSRRRPGWQGGGLGAQEERGGGGEHYSARGAGEARGLGWGRTLPEDSGRRETGVLPAPLK